MNPTAATKTPLPQDVINDHVILRCAYGFGEGALLARPVENNHNFDHVYVVWWWDGLVPYSGVYFFADEPGNDAWALAHAEWICRVERLRGEADDQRED